MMKNSVAIAVAILLVACGSSGGDDGDSGTNDTTPNLSPIADAGSDQAVNEREPVTLDGSASNDSDGTISTYRWTQVSGQQVSIVNATQASATFTAPEVTPANEDLVFQLSVTDNRGASSTDQVSVSVANVNLPPVANAGADRLEPERTPVDLDGSLSSDPDVGITAYTWMQISGPPVSIGAANQAVASVSTPEVGITDQDLVFELTVTDDEGEAASDQVTISVFNVNLPPTADAGPDQSAYEGQVVTLDASASVDQDGTIVSYSWALYSGLVITLPATDQVQLSFTVPPVAQTTENVYQVTVTDDLGAESTDLVSVLLRPITAPAANAGPDQTVVMGSIVKLTGLGSTDEDGEIVEYQWLQTVGPAVQLDDATSAEPSFTAPDVSGDPLLIQFELTVVDDSGTSGVDSVDITVTPPSHALSGTVTVPDGSLRDGDVNDPAVAYEANDTPATAQLLPIPAKVGGYANRPFSGATGRSYAIGDVSDYYRVQLAAGQAANMYLDAGTGDLDLYLWDVSGTQILDASLSFGGSETVTAPAAAEFLVEVYTFSGSSNYVVQLEQPSVTAAARGGFSLHSEFVPGEAIVRYNDGAATNGAGPLKASLRSALDLKVRAGAPSRAMLVTVNPDLEAASHVAGFADDEMSRRAAALRDDRLRDKYRTLLAIKLLAIDPSVRYAEPNYLRKATAVPNDANYNQQWHYPFINLPDAWDQTMGDPSVIVAVIDTGVLLSHPDLQGQLVDGYDFISSDANSNDGDGIDPDPDDPGDGCGSGASSFHGTHVAGTVAAATNNLIGVAGVAGGARIMPLRTLGCDGGTSFDIGQAVLYAAGIANTSGESPDVPADILNLSLGGGSSSQFDQDIYTAARNAGTIIVAAAGNGNTNAPSYPASYDGVISVSAIGVTGNRASYSNYGVNTDVAAPGGDFTPDLDGNGFPDLVMSTDGDDSGDPLEFVYGYKAGTSMATPHVAGVIALMKSVNDALTPADIDAMLVRGEIVLEAGALGWDPFFGWGVVDAAKAVTAAVAAVGNPPADSPAMDVRPRQLHFGAYTNDLSLDISNTAGGSLVVGEVTIEPGASWLSITPDSIDANGVGSYNVSADRAGLPDGSYNAAISVASNANTAQLEATLIVAPPPSTAGDAGQLYVVLVATSDDTSRFAAAVFDDEGTLRYEFPAVYASEYRVVAGSDLDNDFVICDAGEACGQYLEYAAPTPVTIDADTVLDTFPVNFDWFLPSSTSTGSGAATEVDVQRNGVTPRE